MVMKIRGEMSGSLARTKPAGLAAGQPMKARDFTKSLKAYIHELSKFPLLTIEEERRLIQTKDHNPADLDKLVNANLRFVVAVAKQYMGMNHDVPLIDLIGAGNVGLTMGVKKFRPVRENRLLSYAVWWIRQKIMEELKSAGRTVELPMNAYPRHKIIVDANVFLCDKLGREPTEEEISEYCYLKIEEVRNDKKDFQPIVSLDQPVGEDGKLSLIDLLENGHGTPALLREEEAKNKEIRRSLGVLAPRSKSVIEGYFGLDDGRAKSLEEIGQMLGLTRERVRQIKEKALRKLRRYGNKNPALLRYLSQV